MTVQSARVNQIVVGDDTTLLHQIMGDVAFNAVQSLQPVMVNSGDIVDFFYPQANPTDQDMQGYRGVAVGSYPTSQFNVYIANSLPQVGTQPQQGSSYLMPGLAQTVRAEIIRLKANPTATLVAASNVVTVSSLTNIELGMTVIDPNLPGGTIVVGINSGLSQITLNNNAYNSVSDESLSIGAKQTYYLYEEVDILARDFPSAPQLSNLNLT